MDSLRGFLPLGLHSLWFKITIIESQDEDTSKICGSSIMNNSRETPPAVIIEGNS